MATDTTIHRTLEIARRDLLDLSPRNRLIHTPRGGSRHKRIDVVDELADEVFRRLVRDGKAMSFLPGRETDAPEDDAESEDGTPRLDQPDEDEETGPDGRLVRHTDSRLQPVGQARPDATAATLPMNVRARMRQAEPGLPDYLLGFGRYSIHQTVTTLAAKASEIATPTDHSSKLDVSFEGRIVAC